MSINCRINNGVVEAQNGMASILYKSLERKFGKQDAMDYYALTESDDYIENTTGERDMNGEMNISDFMKYVTKIESDRDFSQETLELQLMTNDFSKLNKLYDVGVFNPSKRNLMASGLFTADEAENIAYSKEKQKNLKIFLDNLNLQEGIEPITEFKVKSNETNSIGMKPLLNPEEIKKEDLSNQKDVHEIDVIYPDNQTFETIINTVDVNNLTEVENSASRIIEFADKELIIDEFDNLQDSFIDAGLEIPITEVALNNKSIEWLQNFAKEVLDFTQELNEEGTKKFASFLDSIIERPSLSIERIENESPATFRKYESLNDEVTDFKEKSLIKHSDGIYQSIQTGYTLNQLYEALYKRVQKDNIDSKIKKVKNKEDKKHILFNRNSIFKKLKNDTIGGTLSSINAYLDTNIEFSPTYYEMSIFLENVGNALDNGFNFSIMEEDTNTTEEDIQELYNIVENKLYTIDKQNNTNTIRGITINLSRKEINDEINKEVVLEDIKSYIMSNIDSLPQTDTETAETIIAIKKLAGAPIEIVENYKVPTGEVAINFISEFNKKRLDNKRRNTPLYNRFYKFFKVDHKGISPIDLGDFTRLHITRNVPDNMKDELTNYFSQNKNTIFDMSEDTAPMKDGERIKALNNPFSIKPITSDYSIENEDEIVTSESKQFVRIRGEVFENVLSNGENNLYKKITNSLKPITNKKPSFLNSFNKTKDNTIEYKKYLTQDDLAEINAKHFSCR